MVDYESDTAVSSIYDHRPATPPVRDNTRIAPNQFVKRDEVPLPIAQHAVVDFASGVLHNTLDEDQEKDLQMVDDCRLQAHIVATANAHSGYLFTPLTVDERFSQNAGHSLATWIAGPKAVTATAIAEREAIKARYLRVERMIAQEYVDRLIL
uniref:Uncharacterized protein n=1 Tax=Peronospora matthiolae TaxID=2874970 RepID=A0AAV1TFF9_9STRA